MKFSSEYNFYVSESKQIWDEYREKEKKKNEKKENKDKVKFSPDGILNPKEYFGSGKLKIMFILKENHNKGEWNIINDIENEKKFYKSSKDSSHNWASSILRTLCYTRDKQWKDKYQNCESCESCENCRPNNCKNRSKKNCENCRTKNCENWSTGFAYLNFKKLDQGKTTTKYSDLEANVEADKSLLKKQIIACCPDIIFCCAVRNYELLVKVMGNKDGITDISDVRHSPSNKILGHIIKYKIDDKEKKLLAINWFHPSRPKEGYTKENCQTYLDQLRPWFKPYSRL